MYAKYDEAEVHALHIEALYMQIRVVYGQIYRWRVSVGIFGHEFGWAATANS